MHALAIKLRLLRDHSQARITETPVYARCNGGILRARKTQRVDHAQSPASIYPTSRPTLRERALRDLRHAMAG